jgi:hypothetical protein
MIYSESKNFLFIAIDKTGSTSVQALLKPYAHTHQRFKYLRKRLKFAGPLTRALGIYRHTTFPVHATAGQLKRHFPDAKWDAMFKFCFVRQPLDRITSRYEFLRQEGRLGERISFDEYLNSILLGKRDFCHQHQYVLDKHSNLLVDWWGKLESIQTDCDALAQLLNIPNLSPPPRLNSSKANRIHYLDYYSHSQRKAAETFVRQDMDLFHYAPH